MVHNYVVHLKVWLILYSIVIRILKRKNKVFKGFLHV